MLFGDKIGGDCVDEELSLTLHRHNQPHPNTIRYDENLT